MHGDGEDEIAFGDQDSNDLVLGTSPDGGDTATPGADGSVLYLFSSVLDLDLTVGSDFAFLPSPEGVLSSSLPSSSQGNDDMFEFSIDDTSNLEGQSFAFASDTDGDGDGGFYSFM